MATKKNTASNLVLTVIICIVLLAAIVLCIFAVVSSGSDNPQTTKAPVATPGDGEAEEDSFDPNEIVIRQDPTVMTVDLLPVKYSEFCYFYSLSADEVLGNAESPEDVIANGIDGKPFQTVITDMAKEYAAKYVLYRDAYEKENYIVDETYLLYLQSNFMPASDKEELDEMNAELLQQYGVVRNEYIDILVYNDAIAKYRTVLTEKANYSEAELKDFYDTHTDLFREKSARVIVLKPEDAATALQLADQINSGDDMTELVSEYSVDESKYANQGLWEGKVEAFISEGIRNFLSNAAVNDVAVITEDNAVYVVRCEDDGSFAQKKDAISDYKAVYDFDNAILQKIRNKEVEITVEEAILESMELPLCIDKWVENTES